MQAVHMWMDNIKHLAYMTVTTLILCNLKPKSYVLAKSHFHLQHTGMNIAEFPKKIMKKLSISLSQTVFVQDNGANIFCAMRILGVVHFTCLHTI
jgi:hypothetical protein